MKNFGDFVSKYNLEIPEEHKENFEKIYMLIRIDLQQDINKILFGDLLELAKVLKQVKDIKNRY